MPGLRLTAPQAQCLFGLDSETCDALLATLLDSKFLIRTHTGLFALAAEITVAVVRRLVPPLSARRLVR